MLTFAVALLNFLTLLFTVVRGTQHNLSEINRFYANGFTLTFSGYPIIVDSCGKWLVFWSRLHFAVSLAMLIALAVIAFLRRGGKLGRLGILSTVASCVMSGVYMVNGIVANAAASTYAGDYNYSSYTLSFIPMILIFAITVYLVITAPKLPTPMAEKAGAEPNAAAPVAECAANGGEKSDLETANTECGAANGQENV